MTSKPVKQFKQGAQMLQTDRRTDHAMDKRAGIGETACAAKSDWA